MNQTKKICIKICLAVFLFLMGGYITLDWFQFSMGLVNHLQPEILYVRITKLISSFICFLLILLIQKDGITPGDTKRLFLVFSAIFTAEVLFFFDLNYIGTAFFVIANIFLIIRHLHRFKDYLKRTDPKKSIREGAIKAAVLLVIYIMILIFLLFPVSGLSFFFIVIIFYGLLISIALWATLTSITIGFLPRPNAFLASAGLIFLFLGDMAVGYKFLSEPSVMSTIATFSVWIFYAPSILLLALSGYDLKKLFWS